MKLLLVDDDEIERMALRDIVRAQGPWEIEEAASGDEALELLYQGTEYQAAFFDIRMPGMDGVQLLTQVRQEEMLRGLRVIMTSSTRERETIVSLGRLGISGYLVKPYEYQKTSASLAQLLGSSQVTTSTLAARNLLAKTVLIVEDDDLMRKMLVEVLGMEPDWEIVEAPNGLAALEVLRNGLRPDVILLDLKMPKLDGRTLLTRIREDDNLRRTPVIIASGEQDRNQIRAVAQLRISGYLLKPFDIAKTRALVKQVVNTANSGSVPPM